MPSRLSSYIRVAALLSVCVFLGAGCSSAPASAPAPSPVSGPRPALFEGLSPTEAARKLNLTSGSVLKMRQHIEASGMPMARELDLGADVKRDIVIRRYAPDNRVDIEWKATVGKEQQLGSIVGGNLINAYDLFPLPYWKGDEQSPYGSSVLWLSRNIYENLSRSHFSTFRFGLLNPDIRATLPPGSHLAQAMNDLAKQVATLNTDVTLTTAEPTSTQALIVNGTSTQVEVFVARNWFGEMTVLNNPQNPLVLKIKMNKLPVAALNGGILDYEITEIKDVME